MGIGMDMDMGLVCLWMHPCRCHSEFTWPRWKAIKETSELHLADLEIESMGEGLPKFPNLEVITMQLSPLG